MDFIDPAAPLSTCASPDCMGCPVSDSLHCHFSAGGLVHFYSISFPSFLVGGAAILAVGLAPLFIWIGIVVAFFGFIEIRVMCSHCPHYAEEGATLRCWANYGSPKLWKYRPGPMTTVEKAVFFGGLAMVWGFPLPFFFVTGRWFLLVLFVLVTTSFFMTLRKFLCSQCMNFACPLNTVPDRTRRAFWDRNPVVGKAWGYSPDKG